MTESQPPIPPPGLFLSGTLQVDTAINVLEMTELNPAGLELLATVRDLHDTLQSDTQDGLEINLPGGHGEAIRVDVAASALLAMQNQMLPEERRIAAAALFEVLQPNEGDTTSW